MPKPSSTLVARLSAALVLALLSLVAARPASLAAQGVTTAGIRGFVSSDQGEPLVGANIVATHVPSGTSYSSV
ncbi:MAG: hypothetical protein ACRELC_14785, partial [Gemmatimonadota bacterium]